MSGDIQRLADAILDQETGLAEGRYVKAGDSLIPAPQPPLTREQVRQILSECVTVVKPGETLVVRVPWDTGWERLRDYQRVMDSAEGGKIPFKVLVVAGEELGIVQQAPGE